MTFLEPATPADANAHTSAGQPARLITARVRYPAAGSPGAPDQIGAPPARGAGPFPLIAFSQGFNYPAEGYAWLLDAWARAGYVVVDPTYPETDPDTPGGPNEDDILHHPADLRFVLGSMLSAHGPLRFLTNPRQVAAIGQSDGGDVSLAASANSCCRNPAIRAAVILSGAELPAFGGRYYASGAPPLLVIQGDQDTINAPGCSAALYNQAPAPKYYLDLLGAPHLPPYVAPNAWRGRVAQAVTGFLDYYLKHEPGGLARLRAAGDHPGLTSLTSAPSLAGRSTYCPPAGIP